MENIKKIIHIKVGEILIVILFVLFSSFVWSSFTSSEVFQLLQEPIPTSLAYVEVLEDSNTLYQVNDEIAMNTLTPRTVKMVNDTYLDTKYALGIKVFKTSTLDYQMLKVAIHGNISFLKDYFLKEDEDHYYFLLEKGNVQATSILYDVKLWLDANSTSEILGKKFEYEFVNLENIEI